MQQSIPEKKNILSNFQGSTLKEETKDKKENEFTRKEKIDLFFRTVSMLAIGMPIVMFLFQQNATARREKAMAHLEIYTNTTRELNSLLRRPAGSAEFNQSKDKLEFELLPKIEYFFESDIANALDNMNRSILVYADVSKAHLLFNEMNELGKDFGSELCSYEKEENISLNDLKTQQENYTLLDSLLAENIEQHSKLKQWHMSSLDGDPKLQKIVLKLADMIHKQITFFIPFQSDCDEIITSLKLGMPNRESASVYQALIEKKEILLKNAKQLKGSIALMANQVKEHMNSEIAGIKAKMKAGNKSLQ